MGHISLLPLFMRKTLLWQLPLADVCQLEGTKFTEGLDMEAYWKFLWDEQYCDIIDPKDNDIEQYIQQKWGCRNAAVSPLPGYYRAIVCGQLVCHAIVCLECDFEFRLPSNGVCRTLYDFLFAVRKVQEVSEGQATSCHLKLPLRYLHKLDTPEEELVEEVVTCFKGELPTVHAEFIVYEEIQLDYAQYLREITMLGVHGLSFESEFVQEVIWEATHLEVLILEGFYGDDEEPVSIESFCIGLSAHPTFWSRFRLFKVVSACIPSHGYTISQEVFDELICRYLSASTEHAQKVQFTDTTIISTEFGDSGPTIDQQYISFKTIELKRCRFEHNATPKTISGWLGHCISEQESEFGSCCFKIADKVPGGVTRKRKFSELSSDDQT